MKLSSTKFGGIQAGAMLAAPWNHADGTIWLPADGRKVSAAEVSSALYARLAPSISRKTADTAIPITDNRFIASNADSSKHALLQNNSATLYTTTTKSTFSVGTMSNNMRYGLGYDASNGVWISPNNGASGNNIETATDPSGAWMQRNNGAATGQAPSGCGGLAISDGGITLLPIVGSTDISRSTNGATYARVTGPFTFSNNTICLHSKVAGLFFLYDGTVSATTYYTSPTGAAGSWTARTLPFVPSSGNNVFKRAAGKVWCLEDSTITVLGGGRGRLGYTTNGVDWATIDTGYQISNIYAEQMLAASQHQSGHDVEVPYLSLTLARYSGTNRISLVQAGPGMYWTADGETLINPPLISTGGCDFVEGVWVTSTEFYMSMSTNHYLRHASLDSSTKALPFREGHIIKVI